MTILSDTWITEQSVNELITPFLDHSESKLPDGTHTTSYGLSSYGYDIRLGNSFVIYKDPFIEHRGFDFYRELEEIEDIKQVINSKRILAKYQSEGTNKLKFISNLPVINPVDFDTELVHLVRDVTEFELPPGGFCLGVSMERLKLPRDVSAICMEKSTLARVGLTCTVTPLEAEWSGYITLELHNKTPYAIRLTPGMGICQVQFFKGDRPCAVSYEDRNGKYQDQPPHPVLPRRKD